MNDKDKKEINNMSFEEAMQRLEKIVSDLEKGDAPLDSSLELFEEGVKLTKLCSEKLNAATQKVKILTDGREEDFTLREKIGE